VVKKIVDVKTADAALGEDKIEEIVNKDWKVASLPTEEELSGESSDSPMARNNPNSRANLVQYRKKSKETKEKIVKGLKYKTIRPDFDLAAFFSGLLEEGVLGVLTHMREALSDGDEEELFFTIVKQFVSDFPSGELTASDLDDVANLALNRILELRLLKTAKKSPKMILDAAATIEKFRKNSEKLKMGLANRRSDRVDTKNKQSFSIVDVAVAYDSAKKKELQDKVEELAEAQRKFLKSRNKENDDTSSGD